MLGRIGQDTDKTQAKYQLSRAGPDAEALMLMIHSKTEARFYCFGKVGDGIMTVRFTYRNDVIRIIGAGYWRKGKKIYEKHSFYIKYK